MRKILGILAISLLITSGISNVLAFQPSSQIRIMAAFSPDGGADTMVRLLADELAVRTGWSVQVENFVGRGGVDMALALEQAPADGLTLGFGVAETWNYNLPALIGDAYRPARFTFLNTLAPTQLGVVARAASGWANLDDLILHARTGERLKIAVLSPRLDDITRVMASHFGIGVDPVPVKNGAESLALINDGSVHAGWVSRIQQEGVVAGKLVNIVSGEKRKLRMSPRTATLEKYGFDYIAGTRFILVAPAGLPEDVEKSIVDEVDKILDDKRSTVRRFIDTTFGKPDTDSGKRLKSWMDDRYELSRQLLERVGRKAEEP